MDSPPPEKESLGQLYLQVVRYLEYTKNCKQNKTKQNNKALIGVRKTWDWRDGLAVNAENPGLGPSTHREAHDL